MCVYVCVCVCVCVRALARVWLCVFVYVFVCVFVIACMCVRDEITLSKIVRGKFTIRCRICFIICDFDNFHLYKLFSSGVTYLLYSLSHTRAPSRSLYLIHTL